MGDRLIENDEFKCHLKSEMVNWDDCLTKIDELIEYIYSYYNED